MRDRTKTEGRDKLRELRSALDGGIRPSARYTVQQAVDDWLEHGLDGRSPKTPPCHWQRRRLAPALPTATRRLSPRPLADHAEPGGYLVGLAGELLEEIDERGKLI